MAGNKINKTMNNQQTRQYILRENVLSDNLLILPPKGYCFKGGYIAAVKEYTFQNTWADKEQIKRFRSKNALISYLEKFYPEFQYEYDLEIN